jgi:hypothetical protein
MYSLWAGARKMNRRLVASTILARCSGERFRYFFAFTVFTTSVGKAFSALRGRPAFRQGSCFRIDSTESLS